MTVRWTDNGAIVTRNGNGRIRGGTWGTDESAFWARLKIALNARPDGRGPWIKTVPAKDGHMTGSPYYLTNKQRTRFLHDGRYAIRNVAEDYNAGLEVKLDYVTA